MRRAITSADTVAQENIEPENQRGRELEIRESERDRERASENQWVRERSSQGIRERERGRDGEVDG